MTDDLSDVINAGIARVSRKWTKAKRNAERTVSRSSHERLSGGGGWDQDVYRRACWEVMEEAFAHASGDGEHYVNARQLMYAARPLVMAKTGGQIWADSSSFTQRILKDFIEERRPAWAHKIVWDARGHFAEPHTNERIGLGGIEVMRYCSEWTHGDFASVPDYEPPRKIETSGAALRFSSVLFIEKEGFAPLLDAARIADRYDLAIMSTKGMTVGAACNLLHHLGDEVRVFVVHDFDISGLNILNTLRKGVRLSLGGREVEDFGFRLEDVAGLPTEEVSGKGEASKQRTKLRRYGATQEEIDFLVSWQAPAYRKGWGGHRVELNAMTTADFIAWLEGKLEGAGVEKVVPDGETLQDAYRRASALQSLQDHVAAYLEERQDQAIWAPDPRGLLFDIREKFAEDPTLSWDEAIWRIARDGDEDDEDEHEDEDDYDDEDQDPEAS